MFAGGGSIAHFLLAHTAAKIVALEYDPVVVDAAEQYLGMCSRCVTTIWSRHGPAYHRSAHLSVWPGFADAHAIEYFHTGSNRLRILTVDGIKWVAEESKKQEHDRCDIPDGRPRPT